MGWAAANIGKKIGAMVDAYRAGRGEVAELRDYVESVYGPRHTTEDIAPLSDAQLVDMADHLRRITSYNVCYTKLLRATCP